MSLVFRWFFFCSPVCNAFIDIVVGVVVVETAVVLTKSRDVCHRVIRCAVLSMWINVTYTYGVAMVIVWREKPFALQKTLTLPWQRTVHGCLTVRMETRICRFRSILPHALMHSPPTFISIRLAKVRTGQEMQSLLTCCRKRFYVKCNTI